MTDAIAIRRSVDLPERFALVFDRHFDAIYRFAQRRVGEALAEDVAAETFTRAFERRHKYDPRHPGARPWLLGIAANVMRRHWRTEKRRIDAYARAAVAQDVSHAAGDGSAPALAEALDALSRRDRETLLLLAFGDLTYEEIAVALKVPIGTVRSRISRARRQLRRGLTASTPGARLTILDPYGRQQSSDV